MSWQIASLRTIRLATGRYRRRKFVFAALLVLMFVAAACLLAVSSAEGLREFQRWLDAKGYWGPVIFFLFYIMAVIALVPGSVLALIAGLSYGMWGLPLSLAAATTGASLSFLIARHFACRRIQALARHHLIWQAVERAVSESGWRIIILVRLSPVLPFNLQNYFFGITCTRFRHYVPATFLGIVPGTAVNVSFASASQSIVATGFSDPWKIGFLVGGLATTALLAWIISRRVHSLLSEAAGEVALA